MKHTLENNTLTVFVDKRIDATNADQFEQELFEIVAAGPGAAVEVNAGDLEYISSAGLRVFLRLMKQVEGNLSVTHVNPIVYEIFTATGFSKILNVQAENPGAKAEGWAAGDNTIDVVEKDESNAVNEG